MHSTIYYAPNGGRWAVVISQMDGKPKGHSWQDTQSGTVTIPGGCAVAQQLCWRVYPVKGNEPQVLEVFDHTVAGGTGDDIVIPVIPCDTCQQ